MIKAEILGGWERGRKASRRMTHGCVEGQEGRKPIQTEPNDTGTNI